MTAPPRILGVVLAGGLARRMGGGDKPLRALGGRPILARVLERLAPQVTALALNANGDPGRFAAAAPGLPVLPDPVPGNPGPLAGILAGLDRAAAEGFDAVLTVPGDSPLLPLDLAARLDEARRAAGTRLACAASGVRLHPPVGLFAAALRDDLRVELMAGERRVSRWAARHAPATAEWPTTPLDPFLNLNTPEDLEVAEALLRAASRQVWPVRSEPASG